MHANLSHRNYLSPYWPYKSAHRKAKNAKPGDTARGWARDIIRWWKRRKMIATLDAMDDKLLRDIGLYRGDIPSTVAAFDDRELGMRPLRDVR